MSVQLNFECLKHRTNLEHNTHNTLLNYAVLSLNDAVYKGRAMLLLQWMTLYVRQTDRHTDKQLLCCYWCSTVTKSYAGFCFNTLSSSSSSCSLLEISAFTWHTSPSQTLTSFQPSLVSVSTSSQSRLAVLSVQCDRSGLGLVREVSRTRAPNYSYFPIVYTKNSRNLACFTKVT